MKWYVNSLEQMVIDLCEDFGIKAARSPHTGVWVGNDKICAMGVHNRDMVLSWFSNIVPCGIQGAGVTSLSRQLGVRISVDDVTGSLVSHFARTFQCDVVTVSDY